jgi:hypothetical protein
MAHGAACAHQCFPALQAITAARSAYFREQLDGTLPAEMRARLQSLLPLPLAGLQLILVGDFLQVG